MDAPVRYNPPPFFSYCRHPSNELLPHIEIQGAEEEHRQLPPHENVPQGCWPAEEGRCSRLKCSLHWIVIVHPELAAEASCPPGVLGFFLIQYYANSLALILLIRSAYFASEAMGVGFLYVQYTTMWDVESPVRTID
jgi:hypothetical protein